MQHRGDVVDAERDPMVLCLEVLHHQPKGATLF